MELTNTALAQAIATRAIATSPSHLLLHHEDADSEHAAYDGVIILCETSPDKGVWVYLCDDEPGNETWMIDPTNFFTAEVDPKVLTAANLTAALAWLLEK